MTKLTDSGYTRNFSYDAYGNMWVATNSGVPLAGNTPTSNVFNQNNNNHNQMNGASYDASGNQSVVNGDMIAYDAENQQVSATEPANLGGGTETYIYDGNGQRVEKAGPNSTIVYAYDVFGNLAASIRLHPVPRHARPAI
ncbi:MAG: hypothetical protein JO061_23250 [Acidobacteriaceae bacterium]|nr:hypothetical protein [Acidobacteriaceae bacterium]